VRALKAAMDLPAPDDRAYDDAPFSSSLAASPGRSRNKGPIDSPAP
jgi:hypothetical protein